MSADKKQPPAQWRSSPPFYEHLGLKLDALADGRSAVRLPFQKHFGNTRGEVHGIRDGRRTLVAIMQQTLMVMHGKPDL